MGLLLVSMSFAKPGLTEMIDNPWDQAFLVSGPNFPWFFKCFKCLAKQNSLRILRDLQENIKCYNIWIIGVPEEEDKKKDHEKILEEIIVENFPKMGKEIKVIPLSQCINLDVCHSNQHALGVLAVWKKRSRRKGRPVKKSQTSLVT